MIAVVSMLVVWVGEGGEEVVAAGALEVDVQ